MLLQWQQGVNCAPAVAAGGQLCSCSGSRGSFVPLQWQQGVSWYFVAVLLMLSDKVTICYI